MTITIDDVLLEAEEKMLKTEEVLVHEFIGVRTGKARPGLVEHIMVEAYGGQLRLTELAGITTPEARVINIQPWDGTMVHPIETAIQKSSLGINQARQDGGVADAHDGRRIKEDKIVAALEFLHQFLHLG